MKRLALATIVLASLTLAAPGLGAPHRAATDVQFDGIADGDQGAPFARFYGTVDSSSKCEADRKITIKNDQDNGAFAKTRSDSNCNWSVEFPDADLVEGVYTATAGETKKCAKDVAGSRSEAEAATPTATPPTFTGRPSRRRAWASIWSRSTPRRWKRRRRSREHRDDRYRVGLKEDVEHARRCGDRVWVAGMRR